MADYYDKPLQVQAEKVRVAEIMQAYQEEPARKLYHSVAARYEIDSIIDRVACYFDEVAVIFEDVLSLLKENKMLDNKLPPIVVDRVEEIVAAHKAENPNMTERERNVLIGAIFSGEGEFAGLVNEDGSVNQEWLQEYINKPESGPDEYRIQLTDEMKEDVAEIDRKNPNISVQERNDIFSAMFAEGGKYDGYIQANGTVDAKKIKNRS